jgi:hypothetical protein
MSLGNISGVVETSSKSNKSVSSHYAQISPLRGEGLPPPGRMGLVSTSSPNTNPNSPVKSYFQVFYTYILQFKIISCKNDKNSRKTSTQKECLIDGKINCIDTALILEIVV